VRRQIDAAGAVTGQRFVQRHAVAVDDESRPHRVRVEQPSRQGTAAQPDGGADGDRRDQEFLPPDALHRCTVMTAVAVRPNTSGSYISSARAGAVRNVPALVARTT